MASIDWNGQAGTGVFVAAAGGVGGLGAWLVQAGFGIKGFASAWPWYGSAPAMIVLGAIAALLGVYLVANSDTTQKKHTLAFALACGVFWQPVIQSAQAFVSHAVDSNTASRVGDASASLQTSLNTKSGDVASKIADAISATASAIGAIPNASDNAVRDELVAKSKTSIAVLTDAATNTPNAGIPALQTIGVQAVKSGRPDLLGDVIQSLQRIGGGSSDPAVSGLATASFDSIVSTAKATDRPGLAIDAQVGKANVVLKAASHDPAMAGQIDDAKTSLSAAEQFYRVTDQTEKANSVSLTLESLRRDAK